MRPKILIVGDVCIDRWVFCHKSDRPNHENDAGRLVVDRTEDTFGMAALVEEMVIALGGITSLNHSVGDIKMRIICDGLELPRVDYSYPLWPARVTESMLAWPDVILVCDYGKGSVTRETIETIVNGTRSPVIVDPAYGESWDKYRGVDCIKSNWTEYEHGGEEWPGRMIRTRECGFDYRSEIGEWLSHENVRLRDANTIGAGDQFMAALGVAKALGYDWIESAKFATRIATMKCRLPRTQRVHLSDEYVRRMLGELFALTTSDESR